MMINGTNACTVQLTDLNSKKNRNESIEALRNGVLEENGDDKMVTEGS